MLLICEVKEIVPARCGFKAVVKHLPDQAFAIDEQLYRRLWRRFGPELELWGASDDVNMVMFATFGVSSTGIPSIQELSLMPVTRQWLPVRDGLEKQFVQRLVGEGRSFVKVLSYNLGRRTAVASAVLLDAGDEARPLWIAIAGDQSVRNAPEHGPPLWAWDPSRGGMPALPPSERPA